MGGNALKNVKTSRLNISQYEQVKQDIITQMLRYPNIVLAQITELPEKTSFGDLDLLYVNLDNHNNIRSIIQNQFAPNEIVSNGDLMSFDYKLINETGSEIYFQIDLIKCPSKDQIPMYQFYFSYGDFGAILGRILNYNAYKFGQQGLYLNLLQHTMALYDNSLFKSISDDVSNKDVSNKDVSNKDVSNNDVSKDGFSAIDQTLATIQIKLSTDPRQICEFIKLDYDRWLKGFKTQLEVIEYLTDFELYKPEIFTSLNFVHRYRLHKRPFYTKFIEHIGLDTEHLKTTKQNNNAGEIGENHQLEAIKYFNKTKELDQQIVDLKTKRVRHMKFNGKMIIEKLNNLYLEPYDVKLIGYHMVEIKKYIKNTSSSDNFDQCIDQLTPTEIKHLIDQYFLTI
jgi:hypothetical protein